MREQLYNIIKETATGNSAKATELLNQVIEQKTENIIKDRTKNREIVFKNQK